MLLESARSKAPSNVVRASSRETANVPKSSESPPTDPSTLDGIPAAVAADKVASRSSLAQLITARDGDSENNAVCEGSKSPAEENPISFLSEHSPRAMARPHV